MADITLADYTGYIYLELIKAREMADHYAKAVAEEYAKDKVLGHFSVPRFKVPKMTLTIPVLVSGARFNQVTVFRMPLEKFVAIAEGRMEQVLSTIRQGDGTTLTRPVIDVGGPRRRTRSAVARALDPKVSAVIRALHAALEKNPDPTQPQAIVQAHWTEIFRAAIELAGLLDEYKKAFPRNELFKPSLEDILKTVQTATVIDSTTIQSLLINPETNVVKNGSSDSTVFTIQAEMVEEGFFIRSVRDPDTGQVTQVVEFE
jgi:hypothetical protein